MPETNTFYINYPSIKNKNTKIQLYDQEFLQLDAQIEVLT